MPEPGRRDRSPRPGPKVEKGRPLPRVTSSARTTRRRLDGSHPGGRQRVDGGSGAGAGRRCRPRASSSARPRGSARAASARRPRPGSTGRCPPTSRARWPRASMPARAWRGRRLEAGDGEVLGRIDQVEQVVGDLGPLGRGSAWRCRCPCPGTPAWSRRRPARRVAADRAKPGPPPWPPPTCPTRCSRPGPGAVDRLAQPATTGMRARWRGRAVTSTSSPTRKWGAARVIRTSAKVPAGSLPASAESGPACSGRSGRSAPRRPACVGPSTRTSSARPTRAWCGPGRSVRPPPSAGRSARPPPRRATNSSVTGRGLGARPGRVDERVGAVVARPRPPPPGCARSRRRSRPGSPR